MNIYKKKQVWKSLLFIAAIIIGLSSLLYTNNLVDELSKEERKKVELWAKGTKQLANLDASDADISFVFEVIKDNETVPVILADENDNILSSRNLDSAKSLDSLYLRSQLELMKKENLPIEIKLLNNHKNYIYYRDSYILRKLFYYPFIQLGVIFLFIFISYYAFSISRKAEQNQVWLGLSKETAHQLGTPISSLMGWVEIFKMQDVDENLLSEIEKDVKRLEVIADRFSKVGSAPKLEKQNICELLKKTSLYIQNRSSEKVRFELNFDTQKEIQVPLNESLFEWVIENIYKNAIDAMSGEGVLTVELIDNMQMVYIDITDTGKGIPKSNYKTVFRPGYTTKKRGWGLGLSLTKRIIEDYHEGKVFVKSSEINKGTTFRIAMKK